MATKSCAVPVQGAALPAVPESWKFRLDPDDAGHQEKWFDLDVDDSGWRDVKIGATWESQGIDYDGVAGFHVVLHAAAAGRGYCAGTNPLAVPGAGEAGGWESGLSVGRPPGHLDKFEFADGIKDFQPVNVQCHHNTEVGPISGTSGVGLGGKAHVR